MGRNIYSLLFRTFVMSLCGVAIALAQAPAHIDFDRLHTKRQIANYLACDELARAVRFRSPLSQIRTPTPWPIHLTPSSDADFFGERDHISTLAPRKRGDALVISRNPAAEVAECQAAAVGGVPSERLAATGNGAAQMALRTLCTCRRSRHDQGGRSYLKFRGPRN